MLSNDDENLLESLYKSHNTKMYNVALKLLTKPEAAEEAVQEAFLRITDKIERIKDIPSHDRVKFCVIIVRNVSIDILRKNSKVVYGQDFDNIHDEKAKHIEDDFVENENKIILLRALDKLSTDERQLVRLRYGNDLSFKQIGNMLGIEEIEFLGQPEFIRKNQGVAYFVWQQDGLKCSVVANLPINKVVEIANSVSVPKY